MHLISVFSASTGMRVFDDDAGSVVDLDPLLDGAPKPDDAAAYWLDLIEQLKEMQGAEYVEELLNG